MLNIFFFFGPAQYLKLSEKLKFEMKGGSYLYLSCLIAVATASDLSGGWRLSATYSEDYSVSILNDTAFSVTCGPGPCTSWKGAVIVSLGGEGAFNGSVQIYFDSGFVDAGSVNPDNTTISWNDKSQWQRIPPSRRITVHVSPSTHMDPGWHVTADDLYEELFRFTVLNVTSGLESNPTRTYAAEITAIWAMFVGEFGKIGRTRLQSLISSQQIEFCGGGWTQPDEAITRFEDLIDQQSLGHAFLSSVLGHAPVRIGYSADPFGHSSSMGYIQSLNAYNVHILGRPMSPLDPINSQFASIWHPLQSFPDNGSFDKASSILTVDNMGYWEPYRSFVGPASAGKITDAANELLSWSKNEAARGDNENILMILGDDAPMQTPWALLYPILDKVIDELNANTSETNVTFLYSTPSRWAKALAAEETPYESRPAWDMVPLIGNEFPYWVGYYTSRPEFKQIYHDSSAFFRSSSMIHALARDDRTWTGGIANLLTLWRAIGLAQHHDIITGDCNDLVAEDNGLRVSAGVINAASVATSAIALLTNADGNDVGTACTNFTISPCPVLVAGLESRTPVTLTLFNSLSWVRSEPLSILSPTSYVTVTDATGAVIPAQVSSFSQPDLPGENWFSVVFNADIPALGTASFTLTATDFDSKDDSNRITPVLDSTIVLTNKFLTATFSSNGTLQSLQLSGESIVTVIAKVLFYSSEGGSENAWDFSTDGKTDAEEFPGVSTQSIAWSVLDGDLFQELAVSIDTLQGVFIRYRLYSTDNFLHVYTSTGPFASNSSSADSILRLETSVQSNGVFWSDSNGLELQERKRWSRPFTTTNYTNMAGNEPVATNMFPMTSACLLADNDASKPSLALLTANSHACTSMTDGVFEITLNRNVLDNKGERFTGNRLVTQHNILAIGSSTTSMSTALRTMSALMCNPPLVFASTNAANQATAFAPIVPLPPQIAIVSLQLLPSGFNLSSFFAGENSIEQDAAPPASSGMVLLRLRHIFQAGLDDPSVTIPVTIDLSSVFAPHWKITGVTELVVDASETMTAARDQQTTWIQATTRALGKKQVENLRYNDNSTDASVTLAPMQIMTLMLTIV